MLCGDGDASWRQAQDIGCLFPFCWRETLLCGHCCHGYGNWNARMCLVIIRLDGTCPQVVYLAVGLAMALM